MITQQDITKLKKVFVTKQELKALDKKLTNKIEKLDKKYNLLDSALVATRLEFNAKLDALDQKFEQLRQDVINSFAQVMEKLDAVNKLLVIIQYRLDKKDARHDNFERRLISLETKVS